MALAQIALFTVVGIATAGSAVPTAPATPLPFDARNPADVLSVLQNNGASGELKVGDDGQPFIDGKAEKLIFEVDFYRCNKEHVACESAAYQLGYDSELITVDQSNSWNRWSLFCGTYLTKDKHPHVWMAIRPSTHDTREDVIAQQNNWMSCMHDFDDFTDDPAHFIQTVIDKP